MQEKAVLFRKISILLVLTLFILICGIDGANTVKAVDIDYSARISAGNDYAMAILDDNSLWGWGFDNGVESV